MVENNGLQVEYRQLIGQVQELQQSINDQQNKNEQMDRFLKERHGRTDQQVRIEELTQIIKTKRQEARDLEEQWQLKNRFDKKKQSQFRTEYRDRKQAQASQNTVQPQAEDQLAQWRKQLEDENRQEVLLENELESFKNRRIKPKFECGCYRGSRTNSLKPVWIFCGYKNYST